MNLIKKIIIQSTLLHYGIETISFQKVMRQDDLGNLIFYDIDQGDVVLYTDSIDSVQQSLHDFDYFVGDLCYCIYQSYRKGFYEPVFIIKGENKNKNGKTRRTTIKTKIISLWNKGTRRNIEKNPERLLREI